MVFDDEYYATDCEQGEVHGDPLRPCMALNTVATPPALRLAGGNPIR